jgi:hypothetical protein
MCCLLFRCRSAWYIGFTSLISYMYLTPADELTGWLGGSLLYLLDVLVKPVYPPPLRGTFLGFWFCASVSLLLARVDIHEHWCFGYLVVLLLPESCLFRAARLLHSFSLPLLVDSSDSSGNNSHPTGGKKPKRPRQVPGARFKSPRARSSLTSAASNGTNRADFLKKRSHPLTTYS